MQVGKDVFRLMSTQLAQCHRCKLVGCWRKCAGCRSTFYCSVDCQGADWTQHRKHHCRLAVPNVKGNVAADLAASAAQLQLGT